MANRKSGTIRSERLRGVRTFVHRDDPETIMLKIEGAAKAHYFTMHLRDLKPLADRLAQDAALLAAGRLEQ